MACTGCRPQPRPGGARRAIAGVLLVVGIGLWAFGDGSDADLRDRDRDR